VTSVTALPPVSAKASALAPERPPTTVVESPFVKVRPLATETVTMEFRKAFAVPS
jgi:hypothetical protein